MSKYYVLPLETDELDFIWCVMENQTEQLIQAFEFEDEAFECAGFMENGGAFDGFTPSFILREVVFQKDMNKEFATFISE
jgi:hypothetical protein